MKRFVLFGAVVALMASLVFVSAPAQAIELYQACGSGAASEVCAGGDEQVNGFIKNIVNTLLFIIGALAVIMLIIGGIRYTTSAGNSSQTTAAKNTILYAIVGLVLAIFAYAIVNFLIDRLQLGN